MAAAVPALDLPTLRVLYARRALRPAAAPRCPPRLFTWAYYVSVRMAGPPERAN